MRFIIGTLVVIGIIILLLIWILRGPAPNTGPGLDKYANSNVVARLIIDNPVSAPQTHRDIIITVGRDQATLTVTQGYNGDVVRTQSYPTGMAAYAVFLRSLQLAGFSKGNTDPRLSDERGYCALGDRYIYELKDGSNSLQKLWSTQCSGQGTFKGEASKIRALFRAQIPDYSNLTSDVPL